ncbi:MAG: hypothetical protein HY020_09635 [Burkholderiales bacterium]|nr:hypothetical protein [Burkholderiales bacterium]
MAERRNSPDLAPETRTGRPLVSALSRWWSPAEAPTAAPELGYESAHPWTLGDDTPDPNGQPRY